MPTRRYFALHAALVVLTLGALGGLHAATGLLHHPALTLAGVAFSGLLTAAAYLMARMGLDKPGAQFLNVLMGAMMLKLLANIAIILVIVLVVKTDLLGLVLTYFFAYFLFTGFEVFALLSNLRPNSDGQAK